MCVVCKYVQKQLLLNQGVFGEKLNNCSDIVSKEWEKEYSKLFDCQSRLRYGTFKRLYPIVKFK